MAGWSISNARTDSLSVERALPEETDVRWMTRRQSHSIRRGSRFAGVRASWTLLALLAVQTFCVVQPAWAEVQRVGSWSGELLYQTNGFNYTPGAGNNRLVLVMFSAESTTNPVANVGSVTLGGQTLTAIESADGLVVGSAGAFHNLIWLGYLDEAGISSMSGNALNIVWDTTPNQADGGETKVQAATYENVDQAVPIAASASNTNTSTSTIQPGSINAGEGDRLVYVTVQGNVADHTAAGGYTEQIEQDGPGSDHSNASAERDATTAGAQNPTATWSTTWRTAIISALLNETCYVESFQSWSATSADTWETKDLSGAPFNVPAGAVVEVAVRNSNTSSTRSGGVRAVGSSLERRLPLVAVQDGGTEILVMHVQADGSSQIQHYSDVTADVDFVLLGYWTCGSYVERFDTFTAGASGAWTDRNLCSYGVRPSHVAEIVMTNDLGGNERLAGVRTNGSVLQRRFAVHEAESGGVATATLFVKADASATATIEVYAQEDTNVDFYVAGYWSAAPQAYTELFTDAGSPSSSGTWEDLDLTASGVPDSAYAEMVLANEVEDPPEQMGVRANGSSLSRFLNIARAEGGGENVARMHVASDTAAAIEFYHSDVTSDNSFFVVGYWSACNTSVSYVVSDLGAVTAGNKSLGWHINGSEKVAGFEEDGSGDPDAWLLECGSFTALGVLGGSDAEAHGINDSDMVVGWSDDGSGNRRAFRWTSGGGLVDLGTAGGRTDSEALSVNGSSEIVGTVLDFDLPQESERQAFLYLPSPAYGLGAGMNVLGTLGGEESVATDLNDSGQVVGGAENASGQWRPFRWASGSFTNLGTLGGETVTLDHRAEAVSASGNVCGRSYTAGGDAHAFYWDGSMTDLGVLTGGSESWAFGINDSNVVVGTSDVTGGAFHAFVWDSTNGMRDLNNLIPTGTGWTLIRATDINEDGFIVGFGTNGSGDGRAFLLTPSCSAGGGASASQTGGDGGSGSTGDDAPPVADPPDDTSPPGDPVPPDDISPPRVTFCGFGIIPPLMVCSVVLLAGRGWRRRGTGDAYWQTPKSQSLLQQSLSVSQSDPAARPVEHALLGKLPASACDEDNVRTVGTT